MDKIITNDDILLSQGLVEIYDPIKDNYYQADIETAKRLAEYFPPVKEKLIQLGIYESNK